MNTAGSRSPMTLDAERQAKGLALLSGGFAAAFLALPEPVLRLVGLEPDARRVLLLRSIGVREAVGAVAIAAQRRPAAGLWGRVAGDIKDLALIGLATRDRGADRGRLVAAFAFTAAITAVDARLAVAMTRNPTRDRAGERPDDDGIRLTRAVTVATDPETAYRTWRDLPGLPRFMGHLASVEETGPRTSRWTALAPGGRTVTWDAEIVDDVPGERLAWRALPDADVAHEGVVVFRPAPRDLGTEVHATIRYQPPFGGLGATIARFAGEEPRQQLFDDLQRFRQLIETGTVIRSDASLDGRRLPQRPAQPPQPRELAAAGLGRR